MDFRISLSSDVSLQLAIRAHAGTSHTPERREHRGHDRAGDDCNQARELSAIRNPLKRVEGLHSGTRRDIIWSEEQLRKLLDDGASHLRDVALIALWTMQRQADILAMPTLAFDGERVSIKQGKTGARVRVVASPAILPILSKAKEDERQRVLVNSFGQNWISSGFRASWRKEMKRLGIKGVTFHDLRGSAITYAYSHLDRSHDEKIKLIAEISGHSKEDAESIIRKHYLAGQEVIDAIGRGTKKA